MKTYHIIDKRDRNSRNELKHYTFDQLKAWFEPNEELRQEFPEEFKAWQQIQDLFDLKEFLKNQAEGMEQPYSFIEDEVENIKAMEHANQFYTDAR